VLSHLYNGPDRVRGILSIRWLFEDLAESYDLGTLLYVTAAAVTGALLLDTALHARGARARTIVAATLMLWTALFLPQQLYHGWMALLVVWTLMWPGSGVPIGPRVRLWVVAAFIAFGVIDVPRVIRLIVTPGDHWTIWWISYALSPLRMALLFGLMLLIIERQRAQSGQPEPEPAPPHR
jgi:hypothetical protein